VGSGEEAMGLLETFHPRAIVMDLILPRMSGLLLLQQIKAQPSTRDIVVIAVSVVDDPATERLVRAAGCAAYIRKPIDIHTFAEIVAGHLGGQGGQS
jgi:CheY-like chemotaxis protein